MDAVILLSGGLDSAVALALAQPGPRSLALTFDYGQRAARREVEAARAMAARAGIEHRAIDLPFLREITRTALVARSADLPRPEPGALDSEAARETAKAVWVPNRNGVFIAIAAAHAEAAGLRHVVVGFNREEGTTFPDNTPEFVACSNAALAFSTLAKVKVANPVGKLDKVEIVRKGREAGAPIALVWSCYEGGAEQCGTCESCRRLFRALDAAGARAWFDAERAAGAARAG
ncbi:MAG TPA: 7-cyano-7-deazaguanine synthase QueC [Planctomycetota bacterium]|nr:7-cyano-7-deazaguanine synthase QueC [Planctomycetota bacterium]